MPARRATRILLLVVLLALTAHAFAPAPALAQPVPENRPEPGPDPDAPSLSIGSPIGSFDYVLGRGLRLGDTGLTIGGFATLEIDKGENEHGVLELDGVNFLVLWEYERLRLFARGIASYVLSDDGERILAPLSDRLFVVERRSGEVRELDVGEWSGLTAPEVQRRWPGEVARLLGGDLDLRAGGGESWRELRVRALGAFERWAGRSSGSVAVVTHGGLLRSLLGLELRNAQWQRAALAELRTHADTGV